MSVSAARNIVLKKKTFFWVLTAACIQCAAVAQEVLFPDSGLNDAIRGALQKPSGPLTVEDLLTLTNLDASNRKISDPAGLENARNLTALNLFFNHLANFS